MLPAKVFTKDGLNTVSPERTRQLEEKFRIPIYSYNRNLLLEQLFWAYILFLRPDLKQTKLTYSNKKREEIGFHTIKILNFLGINYFDIISISKAPKIKDELLEEDEVTILNSIFEYISLEERKNEI